MAAGTTLIIPGAPTPEEATEESAQKAGHVCVACEDGVAKYKCPACERRTCSVACVNIHKERFNCTGKRPRAEFVAPLCNFTEKTVLRDYGLLEDVDAAVDRSNRSFRDADKDLNLNDGKRHAKRIALARACAERQIRLILAPSALATARSNPSQLMGDTGSSGTGRGKGKGKGKFNRFGKGVSKGRGKRRKDAADDALGPRPQWISWKVEWHFGFCGQVISFKGMPEHEVLGPVINSFLQNTWSGGATKHLLLPYVEAGVDKLEVFLHQPAKVAATIAAEARQAAKAAAKAADTDGWGNWGGDDDESDDSEEPRGDSAYSESYSKLDKSQSLRSNLAGLSIVEFPVLHVALPEELERFLAAAPVCISIAAEPRSKACKLSVAETTEGHHAPSPTESNGMACPAPPRPPTSESSGSKVPRPPPPPPPPRPPAR